MSASSVLSRTSPTDQGLARLSCSFQAGSLRQATSLAAELRTLAGHLARVHPLPPQDPGRRIWIVTLTTPPMPLTFDVLRAYEGRMRAIEHRWPGCRFLGWTTVGTPSPPTRATERATGAAGDPSRGSQRELVIASLLRCPTSEPRGAVHGRSARR
ncbi:MAG TPA: hypothetical protein VK672_07900 [Solirubrobacteraceae bacterium]|nr:hypothetical protein [Solirubrobacteraceae bacterium]